MGELNVQVQLNGIVVDDQTIAVKGAVVVGDFPGAQYLFPGASVRVRRSGSALMALGRTLEEGESVSLSLANIDVRLSHTRRSRPVRQRTGHGVDHRFLVAAVLIVLSGTWLDAVGDWVHRLPTRASTTGDGWSPQASVGQRATLNLSDTRRAGRTSAASDGPSHRNDDAVSGVGYTDWLRRAVFVDERFHNADKRLEADPESTESRRIVAHTAYNAGYYSAAAWHYRQIVEANRSDYHAALRYAWALRRGGDHGNELAVYRAILADEPDHILALSGKTLAEWRLGRLDSAFRSFDRLQTVAPDHPYTEVTASLMESGQGQTARALQSLSRALEDRERLPKDLQVEIRRDIAVDPLFATLRTGKGLPAVLRRHFGAAAPRTTR